MARVLVVDDDPWSQRMVSSVLTHAGHIVDLAADGWEGLVAADHTPPDLLVVEVRLPTADGWKLVETLRSRPEMANLPALFLTTFTEQDRRGTCFRPESDDVLVTPFRLEDLTARVDRLLNTNSGEGPTAVTATLPGSSEDAGSRGDASVPPAPPQPPVPPPEAITRPLQTPWGQRSVDRNKPARMALAGTLEQFGAASVLMLLDLERRSGVLIVTAALGRGRIYVREGRVLRATVEGQPQLKATMAVFELLTWSEGRFEFHAGPVEGEDEIGSSTSFLLLEGARLQDEDAATKKNQN
jgi:DNA-binding response OmpR family regulator